MTEGNFVDYVKINVASGKGVKDPLILEEKSMLPRVDLMVEMVEEEGI